MHEISHWTIAGAKRRLLPDLGYWYAPDGRTKEQQDLFEQVEVKPQAIEWLFAQSFGRKFRVSLDNLTGDSGDGKSLKIMFIHKYNAIFLEKLNYLLMQRDSLNVFANVREQVQHYNQVNLNVNSLIK